ncbi:MAG: hypothetical protein MZU97_25835 [Bacillus subtilis]|nr:hypothetical protein [Bacillus subtilis]
MQVADGYIQWQYVGDDDLEQPRSRLIRLIGPQGLQGEAGRCWNRRPRSSDASRRRIDPMEVCPAMTTWNNFDHALSL